MKVIATKNKKLNHATPFDIILAIVMAILSLIILYPFYNAILISVVSQYEYLQTPILLFPKQWDFTSYAFVFESGQILSGMRTTAIVLVVGVIYNMFLTVTLAYALTKPFPGRKVVNYAIIFTMYFGGGLIPFYLLVKDLGMMDTIWSMIIPTGISFMYMTVIKQNFESIPAELEESAKIDGASDIRILGTIYLPLSLPTLATFVLYYGVERWNEWWNGMLFIKDVDKQPLQLILRNIIMNAASVADGSAIDAVVFGDGVKMASILIAMFPIMCLYPFLQRFFIGGLTVGAVKG